MFGQKLVRIVFVALVWSLASLAALSYAHADEVTSGLAQANKIIQSGSYAKAVELITNVLASGKAQADMAAKALLMRAQANEKLGNQAFALADYNQALWMQGLSPADKKQAEDGRARIQGNLDVKEPSAQVAEVQPTPPPAPAAPAPAAPPARAKSPSPRANGMGFDETPPKQEQQSSGGGILGFFNSLFGSSDSPKPEKEEHAVVAVVRSEETATAAAPPRRAQTSQAALPSTQAAVTTRTAQADPSANMRTSRGGPISFSIQFAALLEEDKAISEVNRVAKKFGADLGGRSPSVMIVGTKDGDTLYKIVAGPFSSKAEGMAMCDALKTKGANCMVISVK